MITKRLAVAALALLCFEARADSFSSQLSNSITGSKAGDLRLKSDQSLALDATTVFDLTSAGVIKGDDSTDNCTALQAVFDANPTATIYFPPGTYRSSCPTVLTNASGKAFNGNILCAVGATIKYTNAGNSTDTNANMQNGLTSYPKTNGAGGDTSGWGDGNRLMFGCTFEGPANGAGVRLGNGIGWVIAYNHTKNNRYGIAAESSINGKIFNSSGFASKNAGIGFLTSYNSSIYYGSNPPSTFWNDNYILEGYAYADGATNGTLAAIEDHGSKAWTIRRLSNVSVQGKTGNTGMQYGYVGRSVFPIFQNFVTEAVNYGIGRIISSNSAEGGGATTLPGVTAAQPSGTYRVDSMPDGFCHGGTFEGLYTSGANIAFQPDCNGTISVGPGFNNGATTDLKTVQGSKKVIYKGIVRADGTPAVITNSFGGFVDIEGAGVTISSGFGTSPSLSSGANANGIELNIGTGGVATSGVLSFGRASPNGNGYACTGENNTTNTRIRATITTPSTTTITNIDPLTNAATAFAAGAVVNLMCRPI